MIGDSVVNTSVLQWNVQGMNHKKDELLDLIHSCNASIIALQATKLSDNFNIRISNYNLLCKEGHYNHGQHEGVALYNLYTLRCTIQ